MNMVRIWSASNGKVGQLFSIKEPVHVNSSKFAEEKGNNELFYVREQGLASCFCHTAKETYDIVEVEG